MVNPHDEEMELVFQDEFDGTALNDAVWKSLAYGEAGIKNDTLRGPENLEVRDGHLLLHVRKEEREHKGRKSQWTAAYVYSREPVGNNVYIESRFKPTAASGVNNAFWFACMTAKPFPYRDRYEVDAPETRKDIRLGDNTGSAHLAWHDWKTYSYTANDKGAKDHIAQGIHVEHSWDDYHTWGLWLGENEFIYYLDGKEVWRGRTHEKYHDQWRTGIGKFSQWFPDEEQRAYGRFGQEDWIYGAGYTGDAMNIIFSTIPWPEDWTPLTEAADGSAMRVDYVRVFKPKRVLKTEPIAVVDLAGQDPAVTVSGDSPAAEPGWRKLSPGGSATVALPTPALNARTPSYFSCVVRKDAAAQIHLRFEDAEGRTVFQAGVDPANALFAGFQSPASTAEALPARDHPQPFFAENRDTLLVVRYTPPDEETTGAVSLSAFPLPMAARTEPYFYRNIDPRGNTSVNQGWTINQRGPISGTVTTVVVSNDGPGSVEAGTFRTGESFLSVLPP